MKKKLAYRPAFKHVLIELIVEKAKEPSLLLTEDAAMPRYVKAKVVDYARDCSLFQSLTPGQDRFIVVQSHMVEEISIDGELFYLVPENAIVMFSSEAL